MICSSAECVVALYAAGDELNGKKSANSNGVQFLPDRIDHSLLSRTSAIRSSWPRRPSTPRKPSPWLGCSGFHGRGARLGTDPGAGRGKINERAEWWGIWSVQ